MKLLNSIKSGFLLISKTFTNTKLDNCLFANLNSKQIQIDRDQFNTKIISLFPNMDVDEAVNIHAIKLYQSYNSNELTIFHYCDTNISQLDEIQIQISNNQYKTLENFINKSEIA